MALIKADRVKEVSTSETTANFILGGAATGYRTFSSVCAVGDTFYYAISNQSNGEWEVGLGTYGVPNILERTTVHASSNAGNKVNFSSGTKECFISATKAWLDTFITQTSGTTNYVVKATGTGTIGNSQIYDDGTNVGIGTTNLNGKLTVDGDVWVYATNVTGYGRKLRFGWDIAQPFIEHSGNSMLSVNGNLIVGGNASNSYTSYKLDHSSSIAHDFNVTSTFATAGAKLMVVRNNSTQKFYIDKDGGAYFASLVGINETSPGAQLQVTTAAAATKGLIVKGASAQSANLQEWQDNNGNVVAAVYSNGGAVFGAQTGAQTSSVIRAWCTPSNTLNGQILTSLTGATGANERFRMSIGNTSSYGFLQTYENAIGYTMSLALQPSGGNVGIGTTNNPSGAKFEIQTADGADSIGMSGYKTMKWESSNHLVYGGYSAGQWQVLKFYTAGAERYRVDASGNVGIGTTSPSDSLHVYNATYPYMRFTNAASTSGLRIGVEGSSFALVGVYQGGMPLIFSTSGSGSGGYNERMRVDSSGYVGINEASPGARLQVTTTAAAVKGLIVKGASAQSANLQEWQNSNSNALTVISSTGNIGVGTSSPDVNAAIHVKSQEIRIETTGVSDASRLRMINAAGGNWYVGAGSWDGGSNLQLVQGSATNGVNITTAGNVGIGTTSPSDKLHVVGAVRSSGYTGGGDGTYLALTGDLPGYPANRYPTLRSDGSIYFAVSGRYAAYLWSVDNSLNICNTSTQWRVSLNPNGTSYFTGGSVAIGDTTATGQLHVASQAAATKGLVVRGASGQSANLQEWQNNSGTALAYINSSGILVVPEIYTPAITDVGGVGYYKQYFITRTLPDTVGDYVEFLEYAHTVGTRFKIDVMAADYPYWDSATYEFNSIWDNGSYIMPPKFRYHRNTSDLVLEKVHGQTNPYASRLRLRRIGAKSHTASTTVRIRVEVWASQIGGLPTDASATGTSTLSSYGSDQSFCNPVLQAPPQLVAGSGVSIQLSPSQYLTSGNNGEVIVYGNVENSDGTPPSTLKLYGGTTSGDCSRLMLAHHMTWNNGTPFGVKSHYELRRTLPTAVGDYIELFKHGWGNNAHFRITIITNRSSWIAGTIAKVYEFQPNAANFTAVFPPTYSWGGDSSDDYVLERVATSGVEVRYRLRRTASTNTIYAYAHVEVFNSENMNWIQMLSGTGTSTVSNNYFDQGFSVPSVSAPASARMSGNASDLSLYGASANGTGNGGNILLQAGAFATSGSNGKVIVRGLASNTANLQEWQNNAGAALASVDSAGQIFSTGALIVNQSPSVPTLRVRSGNPSTTNIQEWQNYYGTVLSRVDANGNIVAPEVSTSNLNTSQWFTGSSYVFSRIFTKNGNLPSVVGNYIELFECTNSRSLPIRIAINANDPHQGKVYDFVFGPAYYGGAGSGSIIPPLYSANADSSNDFELEVYHVDPYLSRFRLRRTAGTNNRAFQAYINVQVGNTGVNFTSLSGTGTSTLGSTENPGYGISTHYIKPVHASTYTGNGRDLTLVGASGQGTGNGGNIILQAGAYSTSGSNGKVIVRGLAGNAANLQEWQNNAGTALAYIRSNGTAVISPVSASGDSNAGLSVVGVTNDNDSGLTIYPNNLSAPTRIGWSAISFSGTTANINVGSNTNSNALYCRSRVQVGNSTADYSSATLHVSPLSSSATGISVRAGSGSSANLQEWQNSSGTALALVDASGNVRTTGSIQVTSNTPAAFTADQNNLALTASGFQRLSGTAARNITGIAPPSGSHVDGRMMRIYNVGSFNLTLKHNSTDSSAPNRFFNVQSIDIIIGPNDYAELIYDGTNNGSGAAGWRVA